MNIDKIVIGPLEENCYLIEKNNKYLLVDPGEDLEKILDFIKEKEILGILITHNHHDHIGSLKYLQDRFNYKTYQYNNLKEGTISIEPFNINIIFTPGHTSDSITYYFKDEKIMITGDFLFKNTIGRCDLETSSILDMQKSINKIKEYPNDIKIYPGHGQSTTLGSEKEFNPYL